MEMAIKMIMVKITEMVRVMWMMKVMEMEMVKVMENLPTTSCM